MGLDMYLTGERYIHSRPRRRGTKKGELFDLGYWRKHPNLHGFIIETFAEGRDECQNIDLSFNDLMAIVTAVENQAIPETDGFFFGQTDGSETAKDLKIFRGAIRWLEADDDRAWRSVYYRASW